MKTEYLRAFMDMACRFGETSTAERLKVGCLIVDDSGIISEGVNGMPPSWPTEVCETKAYFEYECGQRTRSEFPYSDEKGPYRLVTKPECRHAEIAALEKMWNKPNTTKGATMFVSHSPCFNCCVKIQTAGIKRVYYRHQYRDMRGVDYLRELGLEVDQL